MKASQPNKPNKKLINLFFVSLLSQLWRVIILFALAAVSVYTLTKPFIGELSSIIVSTLLALVSEYFILKRYFQ